MSRKKVKTATQLQREGQRIFKAAFDQLEKLADENEMELVVVREPLIALISKNEKGK